MIAPLPYDIATDKTSLVAPPSHSQLLMSKIRRAF